MNTLRRVCLKMARENDLAIYYSYDAADRLTSETWRRKSDYGQIYAFTYSYDNGNNRVKQRREFGAGVEWDSTYFAYAADNALTRKRVLPNNVSTYFYYDANGALVKSWDQGSADATYFEYGPNQLITKVTPPAGDGDP